MLRRKKEWYNQLYIGFPIGFILPILTFLVYYQLKFSDIAFLDYLTAIHQYRILFKIMSLCVLTDLPLFYIFIQFKKLKGAQGVVMAVFFYAFLVLGYRLFT